MRLLVSGDLSDHFHGVGVGPLSKILAVKEKTIAPWSYFLPPFHSKDDLYILISRA